jgi:hypothetical protein
MSKPGYQAITKEQIPVVEFGTGGHARIIAGSLNGSKGPASTFTPMNVWDVELKAGERVELTVPEGHNTAIALRTGDVSINGTAKLSGEARIATLGRDGDAVTLDATSDSHLLLLSGEPINEPVASYGPFVMNTREEISQAVQDFQSGRFGKL